LKEIHDREQLVIQQNIELNHQKALLNQREKNLHEREMSLLERELELLILKSNNERSHHPTPKVVIRSGRFIRTLLHTAHDGHSTGASTAATTNLISHPTSKNSHTDPSQHVIRSCLFRIEFIRFSSFDVTWP
jgi:hypothetical protein